MIEQTFTRRKRPAITSDRWHVIHARWSGESTEAPRFERAIVSEHADRATAVTAARALQASMVLEQKTRARDHRDQIFVRAPNFKSLKNAARRQPGRH